MKYTDLDFFQPERDRLFLKRKKMIPLVFLAIFLILILLSVIYLQTTHSKLTKTLAEKNREIKDTEIIIAQTQANIDNAEAKITMYESGQMNDTVNGGLGSFVIKEISAKHLQAITTSTPTEAFYSNFRFEEDLLTLEGYATSTQVVAKIVYNLESTGLYENVLITNITNDENKNYKFIISADIRE